MTNWFEQITGVDEETFKNNIPKNIENEIININTNQHFKTSKLITPTLE